MGADSSKRAYRHVRRCSSNAFAFRLPGKLETNLARTRVIHPGRWVKLRQRLFLDRVDWRSARQLTWW